MAFRWGGSRMVRDGQDAHAQAQSPEAGRLHARRVSLGRPARLDAPELIFGTEFIVDRTPPEGGRLLVRAAEELGLTFWDTAPPYGSHPHVREGLRAVCRHEVQVASKTQAADPGAAREAIAALAADLGTDYLDLAFVHIVKPGTLRDRLRALPGFVAARDAGLTRAIGLSTHSPSVVRAASMVPEIEVICATYNSCGLWFDEGSQEEMRAALVHAREAGKGVYIIKLLAHGQLATGPAEVEKALRFAFTSGVADAFNIGFHDLDEARADLALLQTVRSPHG